MITLSEDQEKAHAIIAKWLATGDIVTPTQKNPLLLTLGGYAGVGKTMLTSILAKEFDESIGFAFCALSGRAASVLGKKLTEQGVKFGDGGHYCGTIHSLIYTPIENPDGEVIYWAKKELINCDVIVLDEASMISEDIYRDLCSYGKPILAIGDHGQLPPIEGKFSLMKDPDIKLEKIHRQAQDNPIINLSMLIRERGKIPRDISSNKNISIIKNNEYQDLLRELFQKNKTPHEHLDTAVLCYKNNTRNKLNTLIRKMIFGSFNKVPLTNDLVICLRNSSKKQKTPIYNGYRGFLSSGVSEYADHYYCGNVNFPQENISSYMRMINKHQFGFPKTFSSFTELDKFGMSVKNWNDVGTLFDFGYAMTTHKFQGSQSNNVVLINERPLPVDDDTYKRWLYTSITRSAENLTIVL